MASMATARREKPLQMPNEPRHCYSSSSKNEKQEHVVVMVVDDEGARDEELLPRLPDDVAMECLVRAPSGSHRQMRQVCRRWRSAVGSKEFGWRRRVAGAAEDFVFLVQAVPAAAGDGEGKYSLPAYGLGAVNLRTGEWRRVEGEAWGPVPLFVQCAAAGDGRHIVVLGGWDPATLRPTRDVRILDLTAGAWRHGRPMPDARSFFACAGSNGAICVAGGHDESKNALRSAAAYDVAADCWRALPDMYEERDEPQLVSASGRVLAAGGYPTDLQGAFKKTAEWYSTMDDSGWTNEGNVLPESGTCLASVGGKVWSVGRGKGGLREWDGEGASWKDIADGPPGMEACVRAVGVGDGDGEGDGDGDGVFVFGSVANAAAAAAAAAEEGRYAAWVMQLGDAEWRRVAVPRGFGGFVYSAAAVRT